MRKRTPSCQDIIKKLSKIPSDGVNSIVVHDGSGSIPYRTDGLGNSLSTDTFLDFICDCSMLGNNIKRVKVEHFILTGSGESEWSISLYISNHISNETNISPEVIEALYNSFENEKTH